MNPLLAIPLVASFSALPAWTGELPGAHAAHEAGARGVNNHLPAQPAASAHSQPLAAPAHGSLA
ncbi:hypothetical protein [Hymenobacter guriensis]|uniref:Uncharacterized protein n=1 Tax=Hymenobacter guriensis TaxID=2793065 RepID=A0ABS0L803_9BACT|nr:hypothetical protein [Hymenobacter guriensis]MBG8556276.1 hypothetical protein [Hymenobacter guriensis]